ncbi:MAG: DUF2232 domain-containing protein [Pseudolabrys sp.]|nr:DUF2232 domain-containing protein [Pseudolabrys sp.]
MLQIGLVGLGAGAAAALLFASVTSGTWMSIPLFYLAPLPIMIAGLGWSHWSALVGAVAASAALGFAFGGLFFVAFFTAAGLPAWWLCYLALLARPGEAAQPGTPPGSAALDWYPTGRLVVWAAVLAALVVIIAMPGLGTDAESFRSGLAQSLSRMLRAETGTTADGPVAMPGLGNFDRFVTFMVAALPPAAAVIATVTSVFNLWLAARVVKFSGRLTRPWPALAEMTFPKMILAALALAIAVSFLDSLVGIMAGVVSSALLMAYGVLGFAVLHAITRGIGSRPFLLGGVYASVMIFGWPILALSVLGIAETAFDLRARAARKRGLPTRL